MSRRALTPAQRVAVKIRRSVPHLIIALVNVCAIPFVHAADDADAFFDRINAKFSSNQTYTFTALHKRIARNTTNAQTASLNIVSVNYGLGLGRKTIVPLDSPENDQGYIWNNGTITYLSPMRDFFAPPHSSPPLSSRVCERTIGAFQLPELKTLFQLHYKSAGQFLPGSNICAAGTSEIKTLVATRTNGTLTLCIDTARNVILRSLFEGGTPRRVTVEFSQFRQVNGHWIPFKYVIEALPPASI